MPSSELDIYYWDACVPLSYINGDTDRLQHIDDFMSKSGTGFQLITSALSITEVAFAASERDNGTLDQATEERISKLWEAGSPIRIVDVYQLIALKAKELMRSAISQKWSLKPADAIHLATAVQLRAKEFHTYDSALGKFSNLAGITFPIIRPISATPRLPLMQKGVVQE